MFHFRTLVLRSDNENKPFTKKGCEYHSRSRRATLVYRGFIRHRAFATSRCLSTSPCRQASCRFFESIATCHATFAPSLADRGRLAQALAFLGRKKSRAPHRPRRVPDSRVCHPACWRTIRHPRRDDAGRTLARCAAKRLDLRGTDNRRSCPYVDLSSSPTPCFLARPATTDTFPSHRHEKPAVPKTVADGANRRPLALPYAAPGRNRLRQRSAGQSHSRRQPAQKRAVCRSQYRFAPQRFDCERAVWLRRRRFYRGQKRRAARPLPSAPPRKSSASPAARCTAR